MYIVKDCEHSLALTCLAVELWWGTVESHSQPARSDVDIGIFKKSHKPSSTFPLPGQPAFLRLRRRHGSGRGYGAGPGEAAVLKSSQRVRSRSRKPEKFGIPKEAAVWHLVISSDITELCKFGFDIHLFFQILGALGFGNDQLNRDAPCFTQDPLLRSQVQFFIHLNASKISATEARCLCFVCFVNGLQLSFICQLPA